MERNFKDREVQYPNRIRLVPVAGQEGVYDVERAEGTVIEPGTVLDAALFNAMEEDIEEKAKLTQVVRTDAAQSLTDTQKQQALENVGQNTATSNTQRVLATYVFGSGFSTYVKLGTFYIGDSNIEIDINSGLGAANTSGKIVLVTVNGFLQFAEGRWDQKATNIEFWYTVRDKVGNNAYVDIYCNNVPYGKIYCTVRATGATLIDKAINVSSLPATKVALNDSLRFRVDPSKLEPSTANGWTEITPTEALPSVGMYLIAIRVQVQPVGGIGGTFFIPAPPAIGVVAPFTSSRTRGSATLSYNDIIYQITYDSSRSNKWSLNIVPSESGTGIELDKIYYKRIA